MLLYPSLMGADQLRLAEVITALEPYCAGFHVDMMDGHLVPNIVGGPAWTNAIGLYTKKPLWAHLMVTDPLAWIPELKLTSGSMIDFQYEVPIDHRHTLDTIRTRNYLAGISIAPSTPISAIAHLLEHCDYITIMGVNPGFSGQTYIPETTHKIAALKEYIKKNNYPLFIACDGGITESLLQTLSMHGVNHIAVASAVFSSSNPVAFLQRHNTKK